MATPEADPAPASAPPEAAARPAPALRWTLLAADALLVLLAGWLVLGKAQRPSPGEMVLCVLAVSLAACLGCWAFWLGRRR